MFRRRPTVKISATERGAGQLLGGESDPTYVRILAEGGVTSLKLSNKSGRVQTLAPWRIRLAISIRYARGPLAAAAGGLRRP